MNLSYKSFPSKYELTNLIWCNVLHDKKKLIKLVKRIKKLKILSFFSKNAKEELDILCEIYQNLDQQQIKGLLNNDESISRISTIEKWARIGAIEIATTNTFSMETYSVISHLPIRDYQLFSKRIQELISLAKNLTHQEDVTSNNTPGL
jgi:hypothetical protein